MKTTNIFGGLFLIFLGVIFILNNFGLLGWDVWLAFLSFWPLFLIALGIRILFRRNLFVQLISVILVIAVPVGYYLYYGSYRTFTGPMQITGDYQTYSWSEDLSPNIQRAVLNLRYGAGDFTVSATDKLINLQAGSSFGKPHYEYKNINDSSIISIEQGAKDMPRFIIGMQGSWSDDVKLWLNRNILWDLNIETGAAKTNYNLQDIRVAKLDLNTGAGDVRIVFGDRSPLADVNIKTGAGSITIVIPENVGVLAKIDTGLGQNNMPGRVWQKQGDNTYISENYNQASSKIMLDLDHGVGKVDIITESSI